MTNDNNDKIITKVDRAACRLIGDAAAEALKAVAEQYGLTVERRSGRYTDSSLIVKYEFQTKNRGQSAGLKQTARLMGLPEDIVGRTFYSGGKPFVVIDIVTRRRKYPISARGVRGGKYKFRTADVKQGLMEEVRI